MALGYFVTLTLFKTFAYRIKTSVFTIPSTEAWLYSAGLLLVLTVISLAIGFQQGFLQFKPIKVSWLVVIGILVNCLFRPAIAEELFFRVLLLPHLAEHASIGTKWLWGCISLILFIVYHPLNALSFFPAGRTTFNNPIFLLLAALLGVVCTLAYWHSGSLWPSVMIHWLVVVVWLLCLGGYQKLIT